MENPIVLPPFPLQALCEKFNETAAAINITGDMDQLIYTMTMNGLTVEADWSSTESNDYSAEDFNTSGMPELIAAIFEAQVSMWGEDPSAVFLCPVPTTTTTSTTLVSDDVCRKELDDDSEAWRALTVNDLWAWANAPPTGLVYLAPPSMHLDRDWTVKEQIPSEEAKKETSAQGLASDGLPGARPGKIDLRANEFKYSLKSMVREMSNVFFTVGELDPWGWAGLTEEMALQHPSNRFAKIKRGGHHADTFFQHRPGLRGAPSGPGS